VAVDYPANTIWFIDAGARGQGSAVAIRLRKQGAVGTEKTYLLTCAHVLSGAAEDSVFRAWPPDVGYTTPEAKEVKVDVTLRGLSSGEAHTAQDWVILKFCNIETLGDVPTIKKWAKTASAGRYTIWGYMGGDDSFHQSKTIPRQSIDFPFENEFQGEICLSGSGTRPGTSVLTLNWRPITHPLLLSREPCGRG
jgi:hypothetical protein